MAGLGSSCETRFMYINSLAYGVITANSGNLAGFPARNVVTSNRGELWITAGNFKVDDTNNKLYFLVNSNPVTITLTNGNYSGTTLGTQINSKLTTAAVGLSCSYNSTTYKFKFNRTNSNTIYAMLSIDTNATWDDIGFIGNVDILFGDDNDVLGLIRIHTHEYIDFDLGYSMDISFFALMPQRNYSNMLTAGATINIKASNVNDAATAPLNVNIASGAEGSFHFIEQGTPISYRYVWFTLIDPENSYGPNLVFSQLFLGGYIALPNRTVDALFTIQEVDRALRTESQAGGLYFERYGRHKRFSGLKFSNIPKAQTSAIQQLYFDIGKSNSFYLSLDSGNFNDDIYQFTSYGVFDNDPTITAKQANLFDANFEFRSN